SPNGAPPAFGPNGGSATYGPNGGPPAYAPYESREQSYETRDPAAPYGLGAFGQPGPGQPLFGRPPSDPARGDRDDEDGFFGDRETVTMPAIGGRRGERSEDRSDARRRSAVRARGRGRRASAPHHAAVAGVAAAAGRRVLPGGPDPHVPAAGVLHPVQLDGGDAARRRPGARQQDRL